jgi:hypothetical protein
MTTDQIYPERNFGHGLLEQVRFPAEAVSLLFVNMAEQAVMPAQAPNQQRGTDGALPCSKAVGA